MTLVGLLRPDRPRRVVAEAEARVVAAELERRLGEIVVDLRVEGPPLGPWASAATASWPAGVDVVVDAQGLWRSAGPLTPLFGRTLDGTAAEVRRRMLQHLGIVPVDPFVFDAARLRALDEWYVSPTDLWLVARAAASVDSGDPAVDALVAPVGDALDRAFDELAADISTALGDSFEASVARLTAERDRARRAAIAAHDELRRTQVDLAARLDELAAENAVLRERLERNDVGSEIDTA